MKVVEELDTDWQVQGFDREMSIQEIERAKNGWIAAQVPGVVSLDLLRGRRTTDPFYALKEKDAFWIEEKEWWYRHEFSLNEENPQWRKTELVFEGLDTFANIYLNEEEIGKADNMFIPWRFNVTDKIKKKNVLLVKFSPTISVLRKIQAMKEPLRASNEPARVYARKAQYSFGWDWGPRLPGVGIWRRAYISRYNMRCT